MVIIQAAKRKSMGPAQRGGDMRRRGHEEEGT